VEQTEVGEDAGAHADVLFVKQVGGFKGLLERFGCALEVAFVLEDHAEIVVDLDETAKALLFREVLGDRAFSEKFLEGEEDLGSSFKRPRMHLLLSQFQILVEIGHPTP